MKIPATQHSSQREPVSLAGNQQLIWIGQQMLPDTPLYEVHYCYTFHGNIDSIRFAKAVRQWVATTELMRYVATDQAWNAVVVREVRDTECQIVDVSSEPDPDQSAHQYVNARVSRSFEHTVSLCDATLIRLAADQWLLHLTIHHALTDAYSARAIMKSLAKNYSKDTGDLDQTSPHVYASYVNQEVQSLQGPAFEKSRQWFGSRDQSYAGTRFYSAKIATESARQTRVVVALRKDENQAIFNSLLKPPFRQVTASLSQFNLFATTMFAWLHRLNPTADACIGVTAHGRSNMMFRDVVGMFMQLLPFRVQMDSKDTLESLSRQIAVETIGLFSNAHAGSMTAQSQHAFDVALNVIDLTVDDFCGIPTSLQWLHNGYGDPNRRLTISVNLCGENQWELFFDFADEAFSARQREQAIAHFRQTLMSVVASPSQTVAAYELLTDQDLQLIEKHSGTIQQAIPENLWDRFVAACQQCPDAIAIRAATMQMTYHELRQRAENLAVQLNAMHCGCMVPVHCGRDANAVVSMLAVLASGRCFLILDSSQPVDRIQRLVAQSGCEVMIDATHDTISLNRRDSIGNAVDPLADGACYVLFTSGSTGQPNGVVVGHESLWNLLAVFEAIAPLDSDCRVSWWTNVGFDVAMYEVFSALLYARTLCIPDDLQRLDAGEMLNWLLDQNITSAYLPSFFLDATDRFLAAGQSLSLKRLLVGVDPIPQRLLVSIAEQLPEVILINGYGPTESTVCATLHRIDRHDRSRGTASIGNPVQGNQIRIVDHNGQLCPPGVVGELWLSGIGLARGYLANPELTQERFIADRCSIDSTIWYRTGDRVRMRDDGALEFIGRLDSQLKIAGVRIEPAEIIAAIRLYDGVDDCIILPIRATGRADRLVAAVESKSGVDLEQIRSQLREQLPAIMIPSRFFSVATFPRTANGKIDRIQLENSIHERYESENIATHSEAAAPIGSPAKNAIEFTLLALMQEVLEHRPVNVDTDFFAAGGTSLDAMKWVSRAKQLDIAMTIQDVFRHRTVSHLAQVFDHSQDATLIAVPPDDGMKAVVTTNGERLNELSGASKAIALHALMHPDSVAYHFQIRWKAHGKIDPQIAEVCFSELSIRHPALRTTIHTEGMRHYAREHDQLQPEFQFIDRQLSDTEIITDAKRRFELSTASPLRVLVTRGSDQRDVLAITVHHSAVDQHSVLLLMEQFAELYRVASVQGLTAIDRNRLKLSTGRTAQPKLTSETLSWWRARIAGCSREPILPLDHTSEAIRPDTEEDGESIAFSLGAELSQSIRSSAGRHGVSVGNYLLAVYAMLLSRYSGQNDFLIGVPVSMREDWDVTEGSVGCQIDALPFAVRISADVTCEQWIRQTQVDVSDFLANRNVSSLALKEAFGELFRVMFVPQQPLQAIALTDDLVIHPVVSDLSVAKYNLTWFVSDGAAQIEGAVEYRSRRFHRETIECMIAHYKAMLQQLVHDPDQFVHHVDFRTDLDQRAALQLMSTQDRLMHLADHPSICRWIQAAAETFPESIAVCCGDTSITYRELIHRGRTLAWQLRQIGVGPDVPVAFSARRSVELIVGIIGILESGGAYVPIDPDSSSNSITQMVSQLGIQFAVGDRQTFETKVDQLIDPRDRVELASDQLHDWRDCDWSGNELAYIVHTSGTTGERKGVEITHQALLHSTLARMEHYRTPPARFLLLSPVWFDSSIAGVFWTLAMGGTLIVPEDDDLRDVHRLSDLIDRHQVTDTLLLPSLYQVLLSHGDAGRLCSLARVIVAGESCPASLVKRHHRMLPGRKLFNEYGPTEASVWATVQELTTERDQVSIGRSANGTPVGIVDQNLMPVPIGVPGEILIGGPRLARGYRRDAELTQRKFVDVPGWGAGKRFYRSGDLARMRPDGTLLFLGRIDDQMKVNGVRVEPAEIEAAIQGAAGVTEAAVALVPRRTLPISNSLEDLVAALLELPEQQAEHLLKLAAQHDSFVDNANEHVTLANEAVRVSIEILREDFLATPRSRQRKWLLDQSLRETLADLNALDRIALTMVPGSDDHHLPRDLAAVQLTEQEIMEDWQTPMMHAMADWATQSKGDVLEIGFGRGIAATMIQENGVRSHTIIEMNPHSIADHYQPWRHRFTDRDIRLVVGRWQDRLDQLETYDSVFFHAFPMNEAEFIDFVATSATFAEHFFPVAAGLLRPGGVFTYMSTEIDSLSRRHQRSLLEHFSEIQLRIQPLSIPMETKDAWWADKMILVRAIR